MFELLCCSVEQVGSFFFFWPREEVTCVDLLSLSSILHFLRPVLMYKKKVFLEMVCGRCRDVIAVSSAYLAKIVY